MSECKGQDCPAEVHKPEFKDVTLEDVKKIGDQAAVEVAAEPKAPVVRMQHVIITLADGRRGVFMGPALIQEIEMKLNAVPKLVSVDFDPPRAVAVPTPRPESQPESKPEETPNADTPTEPAPAAGLE